VMCVEEGSRRQLREVGRLGGKAGAPMLQITVVVEVPPAAFTVRYAIAEATSGQALAALVSMRDEISASSTC
jgi:hypothetical protein